jgi:hypothetical protein
MVVLGGGGAIPPVSHILKVDNLTI